ncbi:CRISPR-associated protein Cas4 [Hathewaya histolytica]|uniref:CRISPR-associated protein Cas4 n=1 Tax=Hathewaya histolytica TaxID=1498 RepID=UPI003B67D32F
MSVYVNGTLIWFYNICKREVWLMARNIVPDQKDENIDLGRFIHEHSYSRKDKEIQIGNIKFDVLLNTKEKIIIGETKKSSKYEEASKWQLLYYLKVLKEGGIKAEGQLLYPEEKRRTKVILDEENEKQLNKMEEEIKKLCSKKYPDPPEKKSFCKNCGYREYCYS